jgi:hypothetical protein
MSAKGVKNMPRLAFIHSFVVLPVYQSGIELVSKISNSYHNFDMGNRWRV